MKAKIHQFYYCEHCCKAGVVAFDRHADGYTVITLINQDHTHKSPDCKRRLIRVVKNKKELQ